MARKLPVRMWPSQRPIGTATSAGDGHRGEGELEVLPGQVEELRAAHVGALAGGLALEDELDGVAELAEERERGGHAAVARSQGVIAHWTQEDQVQGRGQEDREPARRDHVRLEVDVGEDLLAEAARAREEGERGQAHRGGGGDPEPGDDLGQGERQLHPPEQLPSVRPMPRPASFVSSGTLSSPVMMLRKMISSE